MRRSLLVVLITVAACARPPAQIDGQFARLTVADAQQADRTGERVRWGGVIVETTPGHGETCMQVVSLPLDRRARPRQFEQSFGRFEACAPGLYDPEVYRPRREVTVVGTVQASRRGKVGEYEYDFPGIAAEAIYLWPDRNEVPRGYYGMYGYAGPIDYPYPYYPYYPYYAYDPFPFLYPYPGWGWGVGWYGGWGGWHGGGWHGDGGHGGWGHGGGGHGGGGHGH